MNYAKKRGGRLATKKELQDKLNVESNLFKGDHWAAVTDGDGRKWVQIGDKIET